MLKTMRLALLGLALASLLAACNSGDSADPISGLVNAPNRPTGTLQGRVVSSVDGTPIPNATIVVVSEVGAAGGFADNRDFAFRSLTNLDGHYRALKTPVGLLRVKALAHGFQTSAPVLYALATDGTAAIDFVLSPGEGTKPDGSAFDPNEEGDGRNAFPWNYDGNFFSFRPPDF